MKFKDTYISPNGLEKFFNQVDSNKDGKVSDIEIKHYISKKQSLRSKYEKEKQVNMEKEKLGKFGYDNIIDYAEGIFEKLGKNCQSFFFGIIRLDSFRLEKHFSLRYFFNI